MSEEQAREGTEGSGAPSARDALLSLAAEFEAEADERLSGGSVTAVEQWQAAAELARQRARALPAGANGSGDGSLEGPVAPGVQAGSQAQAISAAHSAADEGWAPHAPQNVHDAVDRALEAALPYLAAAEREKCAKLAEEYDALYPVTKEDTYGGEYEVGLPFADLLREAVRTGSDGESA